MNKKKIIEWTSRILWIMGALFALSACVCLIIAFAKTEMAEGAVMLKNYDYFEEFKMEAVYQQKADVITKLPLKLYKASGYDAICAFLCYLASKITHWVAVKGE